MNDHNVELYFLIQLYHLKKTNNAVLFKKKKPYTINNKNLKQQIFNFGRIKTENILYVYI